MQPQTHTEENAPRADRSNMKLGAEIEITQPHAGTPKDSSGTEEGGGGMALFTPCWGTSSLQNGENDCGLKPQRLRYFVTASLRNSYRIQPLSSYHPASWKMYPPVQVSHKQISKGRDFHSLEQSVFICCFLLKQCIIISVWSAPVLLNSVGKVVTFEGAQVGCFGSRGWVWDADWRKHWPVRGVREKGWQRSKVRGPQAWWGRDQSGRGSVCWDHTVCLWLTGAGPLLPAHQSSYEGCEWGQAFLCLGTAFPPREAASLLERGVWAADPTPNLCGPDRELLALARQVRLSLSKYHCLFLQLPLSSPLLQALIYQKVLKVP